jgi:hypothetical protein
MVPLQRMPGGKSKSVTSREQQPSRQLAAQDLEQSFLG